MNPTFGLFSISSRSNPGKRMANFLFPQQLSYSIVGVLPILFGSTADIC
jgi:hypothetical protein